MDLRLKRVVSAKELKVHTGQILAMVAEGAAVHVTHHGKTIARLEPVTGGRSEEEVAALDRLIDQLGGKYATLPSGATFARAMHREERARSRR